MTRPDEALNLARRAAAARAATDGHVEPIRVGPPQAEVDARLSEWAVADPLSYEVVSLRRWGAPITWTKKLLVRLLYQFHTQLISDQSRFNIVLLDTVRRLEARVAELEEQLAPERAEEPDAIEDDYA